MRDVNDAGGVTSWHLARGVLPDAEPSIRAGGGDTPAKLATKDAGPSATNGSAEAILATE